MKPNTAIAGVAIMLAVCSVQAAPPEAAPTATEAVGSSGMRVYIDPATGKFTDRPVTEAQRRAAAEGILSGPLAPMVETRHPDGSVQLDLNGHFEMASVAAIGPDGKLVRVCNDIQHAAQGVHFHPTAAAPQRREEQ